MLDGDVKCPVCNSDLSGFCSVDNMDRFPANDDITCCVYCHSLLKFSVKVTIEKPDKEWLDTIDPNDLKRINGLLKRLANDRRWIRRQ